MELHPHFQQPELFEFVRANGIEPIGYSPVGSPNRPERDRTPEDTVDIEDPVIVGIAERLGVHPAVVCIEWAVQRGQTPIPFSTKRAQLSGESAGRRERAATRRRHARNRGDRPELPADQGAGVSVDAKVRRGRISGTWTERLVK